MVDILFVCSFFSNNKPLSKNIIVNAIILLRYIIQIYNNYPLPSAKRLPTPLALDHTLSVLASIFSLKTQNKHFNFWIYTLLYIIQLFIHPQQFLSILIKRKKPKLCPFFKSVNYTKHRTLKLYEYYVYGSTHCRYFGYSLNHSNSTLLHPSEPTQVNAIKIIILPVYDVFLSQITRNSKFWNVFIHFFLLHIIIFITHSYPTQDHRPCVLYHHLRMPTRGSTINTGNFTSN